MQEIPNLTDAVNLVNDSYTFVKNNLGTSAVAAGLLAALTVSVHQFYMVVTGQDKRILASQEAARTLDTVMESVPMESREHVGQVLRAMKNHSAIAGQEYSSFIDGVMTRHHYE